MSKILVTGATGNLGGEVVDFLLDKTSPGSVATLVRDSKSDKAEALKAKGVEIRTADYDDYDSLIKAFPGIDKLCFISSSDIAKRTKQHENVVRAAREAGVKHVIYTSFQRKNETETSPIAVVAEAHLKTEEWLRESGMAYTILKHNIYTDMLPIFMGEKVLETGIYLPAGDGKAAFTLRKDMAEVAAALLTMDGQENKEYDITVDTAVSFGEIASMLLEITGKTVAYISPTTEDFSKTLSEAGVPGEYVGVFAGFSEAIKQGELDKTNNFIETLLGRKPVSVREYLQQVYGPGNEVLS